ncbi:hypothetical protein V499_07526 [Pseudogymnoascus sp. VKM F-103]|nr:hypothetical protein V499_07526 [Pseudogymnoascus sp. VKM F-103]
MSSFAFSFGGDDIEETADDLSNLSLSPLPPAETGTLTPRRASSAFPVANQPLLPATTHSLSSLLTGLPSKIAYSTLPITVDGAPTIALPRRELWDVRVQLMAEDEEVGLGSADVKTGIYEGGFKSWESSVDLVRELAGEGLKGRRRFLELGCGTALPSLAILQRHFEKDGEKGKLELGFADYNPSVLRLVTVPNILLTWAALRPTPDDAEPFEEEGELDIDEDLISEFTSALTAQGVTLSFFSGAWGTEFASLVEAAPRDTSAELLVLAAETIYSPAALESFAEVLMRILGTEKGGGAMVGAKKVYFGVGGSMEDFVVRVEGLGGLVERIREEEEGVRREVVMVRTKEETKA